MWPQTRGSSAMTTGTQSSHMSVQTRRNTDVVLNGNSIKELRCDHSCALRQTGEGDTITNIWSGRGLKKVRGVPRPGD